MNIVSYIIMGIVFLIFLFGIRILRPTERGLLETLGKYSRFVEPGFTWVFPIIQSVYSVDITENMADAQKQEIITRDNLNATVDAQVYYKVVANEESVKASQYNVEDYERQIVSLARTTLRNIIGTMTLKDANQERGEINDSLFNDLSEELKNWGIQLIRTELKEIEPPADVQETMNQIVKAENAKEAAVDFAKAKETEADGTRMASIKLAEGEKEAAVLAATGVQEAKILVASGEAQAIELVNEAADKFFKGNAVKLKELQTAENSMKNNTKFIIGSDLSDKISKVLGKVVA